MCSFLVPWGEILTYVSENFLLCYCIYYYKFPLLVVLVLCLISLVTLCFCFQQRNFLISPFKNVFFAYWLFRYGLFIFHIFVNFSAFLLFLI